MKKNITLDAVIIQTLTLISLITIWGAFIYRVWALCTLGVITSLSLALISYFILHWLFRQAPKFKFKRPGFAWLKKSYSLKLKSILLPLIYLILWLAGFYILLSSQTSEAIISPWQVVPTQFFLVYLLSTAALTLIILRQASLSLVFISLHYFLSFIIVVVIYQLGFGFDSFIHQATEKLIAQVGVVSPKPFYYLGQYSLITIFHKLTFIPVVWLDRLLVPLLSAVFIPTTLFALLKTWFKNNVAISLTILTLLILPFSFFTFTTPQNLAWLFLLLLVIQGLHCRGMRDLVLIYLLALAALATQPIAGIPALFLAFFLTVYHSDRKIKKWWYLVLFIVLALSLPMAFYITELLQANGGATVEAPLPSSRSLLPTIPSQENMILNFIYLYAYNLRYFIGLMLIAGLVLARRFRKDCHIYFIYFLAALALFTAWLITKELPFAFLINYERNNFTDRIILAVIFLLFPFFLLALYALTRKIVKQKRFIKYPLLAFLLILITTSLYVSYPRWDHYHNSRGVATSRSDVKAVRWIDQQTSNDYIVLANQQVSAAALREFGFKKYYQPRSAIRDPRSVIFYYPIPTGSPLYQYYLDMVYDRPTRQTVTAAMDLVDVSEAYFILNKYWWAFDKILREAKLEADSWANIDNGEVFVFKYIK